jgi:hypothetical protein
MQALYEGHFAPLCKTFIVLDGVDSDVQTRLARHSMDIQWTSNEHTVDMQWGRRIVLQLAWGSRIRMESWRKLLVTCVSNSRGQTPICDFVFYILHTWTLRNRSLSFLSWKFDNCDHSKHHRRVSQLRGQKRSSSNMLGIIKRQIRVSTAWWKMSHCFTKRLSTPVFRRHNPHPTSLELSSDSWHRERRCSARLKKSVDNTNRIEGHKISYEWMYSMDPAKRHTLAIISPTISTLISEPVH